jgi:hypothetical protein
VIGDGATWIWKIAHELFPRAIQIVDKFHAKQHLSQLAEHCTDLDRWQRNSGLSVGIANSIPALSTICCAPSAAMRKRPMRRGSVSSTCIVIASLMSYRKFEAQGLCVGSGVVEAGCKVVVTRLKRAGMRWTVAGSNAILALRALCAAKSAKSGSSARSFRRLNSDFPGILHQRMLP